jgi:hypothetical protein
MEESMTAKASIHAGVCGFRTAITATSDDTQHVQFHVESDCAKITEMAKGLTIVDGYQEIADGFDGAVYGRVREVLRGCCSGCIVPPGLFKSMQVAAGLALPVNPTVELSKSE